MSKYNITEEEIEHFKSLVRGHEILLEATTLYYLIV